VNWNTAAITAAITAAGISVWAVNHPFRQVYNNATGFSLVPSRRRTRQASSCAPIHQYSSHLSLSFLLSSHFEFEVVGTCWFNISDSRCWNC
jgi:predicted small integral membrane protein